MATRAPLVLVSLSLLAASALAQGTTSRNTLTPFRSDSELTTWLARLAPPPPPPPPPPKPPCIAAVTRLARTPLASRGAGASSTVIQGRVRYGIDSAARGATISTSIVGIAAVSGENGTYRIVVPPARMTGIDSVTASARLIDAGPQGITFPIAAGDSVQLDFRLCEDPWRRTSLAFSSSVALEGVVTTAASMDAVSTKALRVTNAKAAGITNNQHAGVDEGDIIKVHGKHLVVLRRGRLFTVELAKGTLRPATISDAYSPDISPGGTWYDELLTWGDRVIVIGYSYQRGGTEVGVFNIDDDGVLTHKGTYNLRSNDYYSSRNYASRLIGSKLVFYAPLYVPWNFQNVLAPLPAMRKWRTGKDTAFERIVSPRRIFKPPFEMTPGTPMAYHTVTTCELDAPEMNCDATVVVGPWGHVFYVSPTAVYVWTTARPPRDTSHTASAIVFRLPLDGSDPQALRASGSPVDQFSFLEKDDKLNVLVRNDGYGDWMWNAERSSGSTALMRVPVSSFGDGTSAAPTTAYRRLPTDVGGTFHNRFVGNHLVYGNGNGWGAARVSTSLVYVLPLAGGGLVGLEVPHGVDRIEVLGNDAVVVGSDGQNLHFSGIRLQRQPEVVQHYALANAAQGEQRSHGFFYRQDGDDNGILGLPVTEAKKPGWSHLIESSASVLYLRNGHRKFEELGKLVAEAERVRDDACKASCMDWYGNTRPVFLEDRVFALLGYELVEGRVRGSRIDEVRRVNFAPAPARAVTR